MLIDHKIADLRLKDYKDNPFFLLVIYFIYVMYALFLINKILIYL